MHAATHTTQTHNSGCIIIIAIVCNNIMVQADYYMNVILKNSLLAIRV